MAQPNKELHKLIEERGRLKSSLVRFKSFYDEQGQMIDVDFLERKNRTVGLIEKFEDLQERIEIIVSNITDEEAHLRFRENFTTYDELVGEVRGYLRRSS